MKNSLLQNKNRKYLYVLIVFVVVTVILSSKPVFSQTADVLQKETLAQGYKAYQDSDWTSAVFLLRKAASQGNGMDADTLYMLIIAQMQCGEYQNAAADCDLFMDKFPSSDYFSYIEYQKGRACFYLGSYDKSVLLLSDFCHQNPSHEMYASALFWIAESFYAGNNYKSAKPLYERIVNDFPDDAKAAQSHFRIESIDQKDREEKLLYLLKVTGEEYLAAKENYEKQLKIYESYDAPALVSELKEYKQKYKELLTQLNAEKQKYEELNAQIQKKADDERAAEIEALKQKAQEAQTLLDQQTGEDEK